MGLTGGAGIRKKLPGWLTVIWALILITAASMMSLTLMLLFSRAAQAAFLAIMLLLFGVLALKQRWVFILGIVLLIAGAVFLASSEESQLRLEQLVITIGGETTGGSTAVESFSGRTKTWERAYYAIRDFPLTGMGMNNFPEVISTFYPLIDFRNASDITHAHNHFLIIGTDLGLPGIIAYAALMLGLGRILWRSWRRAAEPGDKILVVGFGASLLAFELFGLFDGIGLGEKPTIFFWFLLGMTGSLFELVRQTSTSRQRRRRKRKRTETSIDTTGV
jgi:putative inorganic carbon (HCO3(-)) transporter